MFHSKQVSVLVALADKATKEIPFTPRPPRKKKIGGVMHTEIVPPPLWNTKRSAALAPELGRIYHVNKWEKRKECYEGTLVARGARKNSDWLALAFKDTRLLPRYNDYQHISFRCRQCGTTLRYLDMPRIKKFGVERILNETKQCASCATGDLC